MTDEEDSPSASGGEEEEEDKGAKDVESEDEVTHNSDVQVHNKLDRSFVVEKNLLNTKWTQFYKTFYSRNLQRLIIS